MIGSYSKELGITWKSCIIQIKLCNENHQVQSQISEVYFLIRKRTLSMKEEGGGGFYKFFQKYFLAQETIDLNISWPSNSFRKYFMALPIDFSFLFKAYL